MSDEILFLPWLRAGLGLALGTPEPAVLGPTDRAAPIAAWVELDGVRAQTDIALRPPDHALALDLAQISRRYPAPDTPDAEYGYFPHVEFTAPELPWLLSPHGADEDPGDAAASTGRLRPWLALVCVPSAEAVLSVGEGAAPQTLAVDADALPDLQESWAWAHVQSAVPAAELADATAGTEGLVIARLICPRRLDPDTRYLAAIVNAFAAEDTQLVPAWAPGAGTITLTAYDTWSFTTGRTGSFEELCERLAPVPEGTLTLGTHPMDMTELGIARPWAALPPPIRVDYSGAMIDAGAAISEPADILSAFAAAVGPLAEQGAGRRQMTLRAPDPVVGPPLYGHFAARTASLPAGGWMAELNLGPRRRAAAGLGARLVRLHQERLMASAWEQVGQLRETNRLLSQANLRRAVGRRWKEKAIALAPHQALSVLRPQLSFVSDGRGLPLRRRLRLTSAADGLLAAAGQRALRPSGIAACTLEAPLRRAPFPGLENSHRGRAGWRAQLSAQIDDRETRAEMQLGKPRSPGGMLGPDVRRDQAAGRVPGFTTPVLLPPDVTLTEARAQAEAEVGTAAAARAGAEARVPALAAALAEAGTDPDALPSRIETGPDFTEPLFTTLLALSPDFAVPGVQGFPPNSVRLLAGDPGFAAALLAGANHEMARELLWREYPASLGATAFRRFWPRPDPAETDIDPMSQWPEGEPLDALGAAGGESAILLVRGDLLRQYPAVRFLLLEPGSDTPIESGFSGRIPPETGFFGFDVPDADAVAAPDSDWIVIIEEPAFEPRFGLDLATDGSPLTSYSELSWEHLAAQTTDHLAIAPETALAANAALSAEATWGLNGAHMAFATHQKPFRRLFRAPDLLGGTP